VYSTVYDHFYTWSFVSDTPIQYTLFVEAATPSDYHTAITFLGLDLSNILRFTNLSGTNGIDYLASVTYPTEATSAYQTPIEGNKELQNNYVVFYLERLVNSQANVQGIWDFNLTAVNKKWTRSQKLDSNLTGFTGAAVHIRKLKFRGWGKTMNFKITNNGVFPFRIAGWSSEQSYNTRT
jgi:hypothetical protein